MNIPSIKVSFVRKNVIQGAAAERIESTIEQLTIATYVACPSAPGEYAKKDLSR